MATKNIVFFQNSISLDDGGVPRVTDIISKELSSRGCVCYFIYIEGDNVGCSSELKLKVNLKLSFSVNEQLIRSFIELNKIDLIVCQNTYSSFFLKFFKKLRLKSPSIQLVCFLHASPDYWKAYQLNSANSSNKEKIKTVIKNLIYPFYNPYVKSTSTLYKLCDKFFLLSNSFKNSFTELYVDDAKPDKIFTLANPLTFKEYITKDELHKKDNIVVIISRLKEDQKKISLALKIWQKLPRNLSEDWKLLIIGAGPDENSYKDYVKLNNLRNIIFLGQQSNVIEFYKSASIFMMTSIWEGLPMSLLEAQQNGVVPIAFDNFSAIYDIIDNDVNGYIISNNDIDVFAESLGELMLNRSKRQEMALNAVKSSERFHVSKIADEWENKLSI
ncbi:glycosyltransferase [Pedobacter sp. CCM 8938]|uniref:Glycosyltransferase n=1 Tax=Pedobacter fastidiosus TaxID=2765361 RepID=A0ABR7KUR8_9SPHI|nr:glycosyltransferase [Pedobacter fastidiosus]MBC6111855.1 glycosyltransferase [Pedobacter fastidiosus]